MEQDYEDLLRQYHEGQRIPPRMHRGIILYLKFGIPPGNFLSAIIKNNLKEAILAADDENKWKLPVYFSFFYNHAPAICWGKGDSISKWQKHIRKPEHEQI